MANAIGGTATVLADGKPYPLRGSFIVSPSPSERTGVAGMDGVHGYTEQERVPFISGVLSTLGTLTIAELDAMTDITVQCTLANGHTYVLRDAWTHSAHEIDTNAGSVAVRWEGYTCTEM